MNPLSPPTVAMLYPVDYRNALVAAAGRRDHACIDRLTDELAGMGLCRRRGDTSRFESIALLTEIRAGAFVARMGSNSNA